VIFFSQAARAILAPPPLGFIAFQKSEGCMLVAALLTAAFLPNEP